MKNSGFTKLLFTTIFSAVIGIASSWAQISFTTNVTTGCDPLTVNFTNTSTVGSSYYWDFGDGNGYFFNGSDTSHTYINPSNYTAFIYAYDSLGNYIGSNYNQILVNPSPTAFYMSHTNVCPGDNVGFSSYNNGTSFFWDFGDGDTVSGQWANHTYLIYNTYNVTLIMTTTCGIDTIVQSISVDSSGTTLANFGWNPTTACPTAPVDFYPFSLGASYYWDFGDGDTSTVSNPSHAYTSAGFYNVMFVVTNGCGNSDTIYNSVEIKSDAGFNPFISIQNYYSPSCPNENVHIQTDQGYLNYVWNAGDGSPIDSTANSFINHIYADTGTYYTSVKVTNFCGQDTTLYDSVVINYTTGFNTSVFTGLISPVCPGRDVAIIAPDEYYFYVWSYGDGSPDDSILYTSKQYVFTDSGQYVGQNHVYANTGTFPVSLTITNFCGLDTTVYDTIVVANNVGFIPSIGVNVNSPACPGETVGMGTDATGHLAYVWDYGDGSPTDSTTNNNASHLYVDTGNYIISVRIYNHCGSDTLISGNLTVGDSIGFPPNLNFGPNPSIVCPGQQVNVNVDQNYTFASYSWDFGDGTTATTTDQNAVHIYDSAGIYPITVNVTNFCGLDTTMTNAVVVDTNAGFPNYLSLSAAPNPVCPGDIVTFETDGDYSAYIWYFGDGDSAITTDRRAYHSYDSLGSYTAAVVVVNSCGNFITLTTNISVTSNAPLGIVQLLLFTNNYCIGDDVTIIPQIVLPNNNGGGGGGDAQISYEFAWDYGDGTLDTTIGGAGGHIYSDTGTYNITVVVTNACGNSITLTETVVIEDNAFPVLPNDTYGTANDGSGGCPGDPLLFYFFGTNLNNVWDFGDGTFGTATQIVMTTFGPVTVIYHAYADTGTYWPTLTVTNGCGNSYTDSLSVLIENGLLADGDLLIQAPVNGVDHTTCDGVSFVGIGGSLYYWAFGDGDSLTTISPIVTHYYSTPGDYLVAVTIVNACGNYTTEVSSLTVVDGGGTSANASSGSAITCNGGSDGSAIATATGGIAPYAYMWDDPLGQSSDTASNLASGMYTVTITDNNGCSGVATVAINDPAPILGSGSTIPASCGGSDGSVTISSLTGGTPPYTFSWDNGDTTNTADSLASGSHTATVTDANGCSDSQTIVLSDSGAVAISNATFTSPLCNGGSDGSLDITVSGGTPPYSFEWSNGSTVEDLTGIAAGTYTVTITDSIGCKSIENGIVGEPSVITLSTAILDANCGVADGGIAANAVGGTSPYTYAWSTGTSGPIDSNLFAGAYSVTVTDGNSCATSFIVNVSNANAPVITAVLTDVSCNGLTDGSINITVTGGTTPYSYLWLANSSLPAGSSAPDLFVLEANTYTLILNDASSCVSTVGYTITEPDVLAASSTVTGSHCGYNDGTATATATGGTGTYTYSWSSGGSSSTETGIATGNETVTVMDANACSVVDSITIITTVDEQTICIITVDTTSTMNVVVWDKPQPAMGIASFNVYRDSLNIYVLAGTVPYDSLSEYIDNSPNINPNSTSYRYKVTAVDSCSNESVMSEYHETVHMLVTLGIPPAIGLTWDNYEGFAFTSYHILRDSLGNGSWDTIASLSSSSTTYNDANSPQTSGLRYQIIVIPPSVCTAEKAKSYNSSKSNTTSVSNPITLGGTTSLTLETQNVACDGTATAIPTNGIDPYTYAWSTNPVQTNATATGLCAGSYSVLVTDNVGDTITLNATLSVVFGITEVSNSNLMHIFPNPNQGNFKVEFTIIERESVEITIYDMQGRLVETRVLGRIQGARVEEVDIAKYGSGLYYIQLKTESGISIKKIILE